MKRPKQERLGRILLKSKIISEDQLERALQEQASSGKLLGRVLLDMKMVTEGQLASLLAGQIGIKYVDLNDYPVDPKAAGLIDRSLAFRYMMVPISFDNSELVVAMVDPTNVFALDDMRIISGREIRPVVSTRDEIESMIDKYCPQMMGAEVEEVSVEEMVEEDIDEGWESAEEAAEDAPIVKYVNLIIAEAVRDLASDIHIEPTENDVRIRYRVDGVLHEIRRSPRRVHPGIVSRLKIMSGMSITERRVPQDGRCAMSVGDKAVDLRVASLPTVYGEKMVLRVLDRSSILMSLEELGLEKDQMELLLESLKKPYGTVIACGPTGSGKTTTLYAGLSILNEREKNVITVEDPVEYQLAGINQVQVNAKVGLSFARALRSILRCDPDTVMIGEIRDPESAKMAIESALTGHMVLCTLHTNDAPSAMTRMIEMGVEPFLVSSAVDAVVSQRLARRLCPVCKAEADYPRAVLEKAGFPIAEMDGRKIYTAREGGCSSCSGTGFRGRIGLFEMFTVDEEIERLVVNLETSHEIKKAAVGSGMRTLREDGFLKVLKGITSIEEVMRVVM